MLSVHTAHNAEPGTFDDDAELEAGLCNDNQNTNINMHSKVKINYVFCRTKTELSNSF